MGRGGRRERRRLWEVNNKGWRSTEQWQELKEHEKGWGTLGGGGLQERQTELRKIEEEGKGMGGSGK